MMKWPAFVILALIALVLQTTVAPRLALRGVMPDLVFILIVHYAMWGPWPEVGIAAWIAGLAVSTQTQDAPGVHSLAYGAAAWAIVRVRQAVFRDHVATQMVLTFVTAAGVALVLQLHRQWSSSMALGWGEVASATVLTAIYSALVAPYVHWLLNRLGRVTNLRPAKR